MIRLFALEKLPRKNHGCRSVMEQAVLALYAAPEFAEVSFCGRHDSSAAPVTVLYIGTVTVNLFEDTPHELPEAVMKIARSY